jgi:dTDP-4-dehydrorhamnose 3,5-epimerase-like enzyme
LTSIFDCSLIEFEKFSSRAGNIAIAENGFDNLPFSIKRIFYLYDIPGGESRGAHAHKECHQLLVACSGSFEVILNDGKVTRSVLLNVPDKGLHIPPGIWASEVNFSTGAVCLVLASEIYQEDDYLRNFDDFLKWKY